MEVKAYYIEVYQKVLKGELEKFPRYWWKNEASSAPILTRYLLEDVLGLDRDGIRNSFSSEILKKHKLSGMLKYIYHSTLFPVVDDAYPGVFKPWELKQSPSKFWREEENCIKATRWLVFDQLKWGREEIENQYNNRIFYENGFSGLLKWGWNGETFRSVTRSFPEYDFKPWELKKISIQETLSQEEAIEALRWYIEVKKGWTQEEVPKYWRSRNLGKDRIMRVVKSCFENHLFQAIDAVYPGRYMRWEFPVPNGYWTLRRSKESLRWMIEEKLNVQPEEALDCITRNHLKKFHLTGMLENGFGCGLKEAIRQTYPAHYE